MLRALAFAAALLTIAGCAGKHVTLGGSAKFGKTAEDDYKAGMDLLEDGAFPEAEKFFRNVKTKYPFSKYAALSDLRLADVKYEQKLWAEAAEAYGEFVRLHPTHEEVDYAEFRTALSHLEEAPGDFVFFPHSYEKDQRQVVAAVNAFRSFLEKHPGSKYAPDAKKLLEIANGRLADHEWYVAEYYFKRRKWAGAAGRYQTLVDRFPGSKHEPEALLKLAESCVKLDEKHRARTALQKFIVSHPQDPRRASAEAQLAKLR
ncbi:MAG TPA: outer membrane protein assembly factor BamD [Anaeromyxobacter sp.]|nr:outer membrane protein assembly factor BamD [Anaeromyxobacter sp.]